MHVTDGFVNDGGVCRTDVLITGHEDGIKVIMGDRNVALFQAPHTHGGVRGVGEACGEK